MTQCRGIPILYQSSSFKSHLLSVTLIYEVCATMTLSQLPPRLPDKFGMLCAEMRWGTGCGRCSSRISTLQRDVLVHITTALSGCPDIATYCTDDEVGVSCPTGGDFADAHVRAALLKIVLAAMFRLDGRDIDGLRSAATSCTQRPQRAASMAARDLGARRSNIGYHSGRTCDEDPCPSCELELGYVSTHSRLTISAYFSSTV